MRWACVRHSPNTASSGAWSGAIRRMIRSTHTCSEVVKTRSGNRSECLWCVGPERCDLGVVCKVRGFRRGGQ